MTLPAFMTWHQWATNLATSNDGTRQYAVWVSRDRQLKVGRIVKVVQTWGINHREHVITGTAATAMQLPPTEDPHFYYSLALDATGKLHLWGNCAATELGYVTCADPVNAFGVWAPARLNESAYGYDIDGWAYPQPAMLPSGNLWLGFRAGDDMAESAGHASSPMWRNTNGVWSAPVRMFDGRNGLVKVNPERNVTTYSCYMDRPVVTPNGRIHLSWLWREQGQVSSSNIAQSYAYSDNGGVNWFAVNGTALTLPITPVNNPVCQTGIKSGRSRVVMDAKTTGGTPTVTSSTAAFAPSDVGKILRATALPMNVTIAAVNSPTSVKASGNATSTTTNAKLTIGTDYVNGQGLCIDTLGRPHIVVIGPGFGAKHVWWNGTSWVSQVITGFSARRGRLNAAWMGGALWVAGVGAPEDPAVPPTWRTPRVYRVSATGAVGAWLPAGPTMPVRGDAIHYDPVQYRRDGTLEFLGVTATDNPVVTAVRSS